MIIIIIITRIISRMVTIGPWGGRALGGGPEGSATSAGEEHTRGNGHGPAAVFGSGLSADLA